MSLIAWYPLNGDTNDYSNKKRNGVPIGTLNTYTYGKIGSSYSFENENPNGVDIPSTNFAGLTEFTMCAWINPAGNHYHYNGAIISSGNWNSNCWSFGVSQDNQAIDAAGGWYNKFIPYSIPLNTWTHILCTVTNGISRVYVNGVYLGGYSVTTPLTSDASNTCIGRETYAGGYFSFNGRINDVRIYDNVLSQKEIIEIAKAKIFHYEFNNFQEPTTNLLYTVDPTLSAPIYWANSGAATVDTNATDIRKPYIPNLNTSSLPILKYTVTTAGSLHTGTAFMSPGLTGGKTYTISTYYRQNVVGAGAPYFRTHVNNASLGNFSYNGNTNSSTWPVNVWIRIEATATIPTNETGIYLSNYIGNNVGDSIWYFGGQIEEKDHSTPLCIINRSGIISDSSEYKNNFQIDSVNTPKWNNTGKLGGGYSFNGINNGLYFNSSNNPSDRLTLCAWINPSQYVTSWDRGNIIQKGGSFYLTLSSAGKIEVYWYGTNPEGYHSSNGTIPLNTWSHVASVWDGTNLKIYINGFLDRTISCTTPGSKYNGTFNIGSEQTMRFFIGEIDDVRVYATALTLDQITEIYKVKASIDDYGNLHTQIDEPYNLLIPEVFCSYSNNGDYDPHYQIVDGRLTWAVYPHKYHPDNALVNMFKPNTSYDVKFTYKHDTYYNGNPVPGGFIVVYSDSSADYLLTDGGSGKFEVGFVTTPASKTIKHISVYYYTSWEIKIDVMESYIMEHVNSGITDKRTLITNDFSEAGITDGLVAWYPLNGNSNDVSRNKLNGTVYGPTLTPGLNNKFAYLFDGSDDYIEVPALPFHNKSFTISMWAYFNQDDRDILIGDYSISGGVSINFEKYVSGSLRLYWNGNPDIVTGNIVPIGTWCNLAVTRDKVAGTVKFYVNGVLSHTYNGSLPDYLATSVIYIGRDGRTGSTVMNGKLQDIRIYNRSLTLEEIKINYDITGNSPIKTKIFNDDVLIKGEIKE